MGKRDRLKRVISFLRPGSSRTSASNSAPSSLRTTPEPRPRDPIDEAPNGDSLTSSQNRVDDDSLVNNQCRDTPEDLWHRALERLPVEQKATISLINSDSKLDILRSLQTVAEEKRAYCDKKSWKFELNGGQIHLRDVAEKIIY